MFYIEIAELLVQVNNRYEEILSHCQPYLVSVSRKPDLIMEVDEREIASGQKWFREYEHAEISPAEAEFSRAPYMIYPQLPPFDAFWLHAVVIQMGDACYGLTAPSGYGKTTNARLWLQAYPHQARIINGDNPIIRRKGEDFFAYGTPFCGKEGYQVNTGVPLKGFCYLRHGEENAIRRMDKAVAFAQLLRDYQGQFRFYPQYREKYIQLLQDFAETVPIYVLTCNRQAEAARVAYEGMKHGGN